jgi:hypothetical protein
MDALFPAGGGMATLSLYKPHKSLKSDQVPDHVIGRISHVKARWIRRVQPIPCNEASLYILELLVAFYIDKTHYITSWNC